MGFVVIVAFVMFCAVEAARWWLRPAARRLRQVRKVDRGARV